VVMSLFPQLFTSVDPRLHRDLWYPRGAQRVTRVSACLPT